MIWLVVYSHVDGQETRKEWAVPGTDGDGRIRAAIGEFVSSEISRGYRLEEERMYKELQEARDEAKRTATGD